MPWYVTGSTGLIGQTIVRRLVEAQHHVIALSRSAQDYYQAQSGQMLEPYNFDVARDEPSRVLQPPTDKAGLLALASQVTTTRDLSKMSTNLELDTLGHLRLIEFLRPKLGHIVYASSCTVYGWPSDFPIAESAPLAPMNVYAFCKVASEMILDRVQCEWNIPVAIMRIAQVYGPGAHLGAAMYQFLDVARKGKRPRIDCPPETFRDYCHVDDVGDALMNVIGHGSCGVFNIGGGEAVTMWQLARICLKVVGSGNEPEVVVQKSAWSMYLDISRASAQLGYAPQVSIVEGIRREYCRLWGKHG